MSGTSGPDVIAALDGNDTVFGMSGDDRICGGTGTDNLDGGNDNDRMDGGDDNDAVNGQAGDDDVSGGAGADNLSGSTGNDTLTGGVGNDNLVSSLGNDRFAGGADFDVVNYAGADAPVRVNLETGTATGEGSDTTSEIEKVIGSRNNDQIVGDAQANQLEGGDGHDQLAGGGGSDELVGGTGDDALEGGAADDVLTGGEGGDTLDGGPAGALGNLLVGGPGGDRLLGGPDADGLDGGPGDDELNGGAGPDVALYLNAGGPVQVLLGESRVTGSDGNDRLSGIEVVEGSRFGDTFVGDAQDNVFDGNAGDDQFRGEGGIDLVSYDVKVDVNLETKRATGEGSDTLDGIEAVAGSNFEDRLTGDAAENVLWGERGADVVSGGGGADAVVGDAGKDQLLGGDGADIVFGGADDDEVRGGPGDDTLLGEAGDDVMDGGPGSHDLASYGLAPNGIQVDIGARVATGEGRDTFTAVEGVTGSMFGDQLKGGGGPNVLFGSGGDDTVSGGGGADFLSGGAGTDRLVAGAGIDYCLERAEVAGRCEITGVPVVPGVPDNPPIPAPLARATSWNATPAAAAVSPRAGSDWQRTLVRARALLYRLAQWRGLRPESGARRGAVRTTAEFEYGAAPVCFSTRRPFSTEIAPPKVVRPVGDDGRAEQAWWRGTLFRRARNTGRLSTQARTDWARAELAGGFVVPGVTLWKDAAGSAPFRAPVRIRVPAGDYIWKGQIYWVRSGGRVFAPIEPHIIRSRTIRYNKRCDFR